MALSFLSYRADRRLLPSCFFLLFPLSLHLCPYMYYTSLFLLCHFLFPLLSSSMPPCNSHTIYYTTAPYSENLAPCSPEFLPPYSYILNTPQKLPPSISLSTLPCSSLLSLGEDPLPYYVLSPSSTYLKTVPLSLLSFLLSSFDTPISCVLLPYT